MRIPVRGRAFPDPSGGGVLVCAPRRRGDGYWARRARQHVELLAAAGCEVDLIEPQGNASSMSPEVMLAVGWPAAAATALAMPGVPQLVDAGEVQFPVSARRAFAGADRPAALGDPFADLLARELSAYAHAAALIAGSRPEAEMLDDFLGRPGSVTVLPPTIDAPAPPAEGRRGLVFVGEPADEIDADAATWLHRQLAPLLPSEVLVHDPLVVGDDISQLTAARIVVVPPFLGARGHDLAARALVVGVPVVAPARVKMALPPAAQGGVSAAESPEDFARAVTDALQAGSGPVPSSAGEALINTYSRSRTQSALLDALDRAVRCARRRGAAPGADDS